MTHYWAKKIHLTHNHSMHSLLCGRSPVGVLVLKPDMALVTPSWPGEDLCADCEKNARRVLEKSR